MNSLLVIYIFHCCLILQSFIEAVFMTPRNTVQSPDSSPVKPMLADKYKVGTHGEYLRATESIQLLTFWKKKDK